MKRWAIIGMIVGSLIGTVGSQLVCKGNTECIDGFKTIGHAISQAMGE